MKASGFSILKQRLATDLVASSKKNRKRFVDCKVVRSKGAAMWSEELNPPLTESGQFDGEEVKCFLCRHSERPPFLAESSSASIDVIAWATVCNCRNVSEGGESNRGIIVAELLKKKIVIKSSQDPAREMFLTRLCRWLGVSAPAVRFVVCDTDEYTQMSRVVRGMTMRPVVLVMEFVQGTTLNKVNGTNDQRFFRCNVPEAKPVLRSIGRIMALDVFTNNWDRIPLIHDNSGNFGNVILQRPEENVAILVAIDNAMTGIRREYGGRRNSMYDAYLEKVRKLCQQLVKCGEEKECALIQSVRSNISSRTAVQMGPKEGLIIQAGVAEMMCRIAKFDKLTEERDAVAKMVTMNDPWFASDLERVDLVFLGDVQAMIRSFEDDLRKAYTF